MPQWRLKAGLGIFLSVCGLFGINLFAFQGARVAAAAKRVNFPGSASSHPAAPLAVLTPEIAVTTGSLSASEPDLTRAVQRELQIQGYDAGGIDGVAGITTRAAIMAFEWDQGLPLTAEPAQHTLQALLLGGAGNGTAGSASAVPPGPQAAEVIRIVQKGLTALGYAGFGESGSMNAGLQRAIRMFESREGLPETGRISGTLASRILRLSNEKRLADGR